MKNVNNECETTGRLSLFNVIFVIIAVLFGMVIHNFLNAQSATITKIEMDKLSHWVGEWEGEGWSMNESRQREEFTIKESIQSKLGGKAFLIEGNGKTKTTGQSSHVALAMLYFNQEKNTYEMKSLIDRGMVTLAQGRIEDNGDFVWGFDVQGGRIEYAITLTKNTWVEKGYYIDPAGNRYPTLEMSLRKVK